jgi:hypothetical protein
MDFRRGACGWWEHSRRFARLALGPEASEWQNPYC